MIWKLKSKVIPVVWDNPIAGENIFQNAEFFLVEEKLCSLGRLLVILLVPEIHHKKVLPFLNYLNLEYEQTSFISI